MPLTNLKFHRFLGTVRYKKYRKIKSDKLNLKFNDQNILDIVKIGGGSSFDKIDYHGQANNMKVFDRWKIYYENDKFINFFDDEVFNIHEKIFKDDIEISNTIKGKKL